MPSESIGVSISSSNTTTWIFKESEWGDGIVESSYARSVFVNGFMHWVEFSAIIVVDVEGKTWRKIRSPRGVYAVIHEAQGQL